MAWPTDVKPMRERMREYAVAYGKSQFVYFELPERIQISERVPGVYPPEFRLVWGMTDPYGIAACGEVDREVAKRLAAQ